MQEKLFKAFIFALLAIAFVGFPFSFLAFGSDFSTQRNPLYPYKSSIFLQDDFVSGNNTNGTIGVLGWIQNGGTTTLIASSANRPGIIRKNTTAAINTLAQLSMNSNSSTIDPALPHTVIWVVKNNQNDADVTTRIGEANSPITEPPTHGIYFEKLGADTNYFCVTRAGGVETRTDTGIAFNTNFNTSFINRNSSGVMFYLNDALVCTHTTNIPTTFVNPFIYITNLAAVDKSMDADYFEFRLYGLTR